MLLVLVNKVAQNVAKVNVFTIPYHKNIVNLTKLFYTESILITGLLIMSKSNTTKFLAKALGFYMLTLGLLILCHLRGFIFDIEQIIHDPGLLFISGFFTLMLSILVLVTHFSLAWGWPLIITLVGCWLFIKSLLLILFPDSLGYIAEYFIKYPWFAYTVGIVFIYCAGNLLYFGFSKTHNGKKH